MKLLKQRIKSNGGRSNGLITAPRRSNFIRRLYRFLDFRRECFPESKGTILRMCYDPNRNCRIALLVYPEGCLSYVIPAETNQVGDKLENLSETKPGNSSFLRKMTSGSLVYNLCSFPKLPAQYVRSAGSSAILVKTTGFVSLLKLKSGEYRYFFSETPAVYGKVIDGDFFLKDYRLAGKTRRLGFRPRNRPLARNPVDHPMGGRTKGGTVKLTPKGKICLNTETKRIKGKLVVIKAREKKKI